MKGEKAVEIFELVKRGKMLPQKMEDLVPLSFIGQTAVIFYRQMIKGFDQLKMTESQRKRTLKDGQEAGEMLLDIETRIGEMVIKAPQERHKGVPKDQRLLRGVADKYKRLGLPSQKRMVQFEAISRHPEIVEKVKAQAREMEDIPTRTAVVNEIRHQKVKERFEKKIKNKDVYNLGQELLGMVEIAKALRSKLIKIRMKVEEMGVENITGLDQIVVKFKMRDLIEELKWLWDILGTDKKQLN